ncbi:hypothetical protein ERJ75_000627400 [Trypanosoma vivax]|nr:hypothetical protein ERJ75_000627400 [Trypanosoma vivax]
MVWPQCPTRRTADGERQRGARQQIARGKWNAKARGKDVRGRGDLGLTIEGGATRAGRSQAAAERRRSVVERRETRGCARGMLTMTAMSRVGKVAVRASSRAAEARCEDVLAGERAVVGKLAQSARRVSWCATAIGAQKQRRKTAGQGGDAGTHRVARPRKQAHVRAKRSVVALHRQRLPWPGRLAGTQGQGSVPASTAKCDAGADKGARKAGAAVSVLPVLSKGKAGECARDAVGRDAGASSFCAEEVSCVRKCLRDDDACATTRQR